MTAWPSILGAGYRSTGSVFKPAVRTRSEAGYMQSRAKVTLAKEKGQLVWNAISDADFATFKTFFIANQGGSFDGPDDTELEDKICTFSDDDFSYAYVGPGLKSLTVNIEEI